MKRMHVVVMTKKEYSVHDYIDVSSVSMVTQNNVDFIRVVSDYRGTNDYTVENHDAFIMGIVDTHGEEV